MLDPGRRPAGRLFYWAIAIVATSGLWISAAGSPQSGIATTTAADTVYLADGTFFTACDQHDGCKSIARDSAARAILKMDFSDNRRRGDVHERIGVGEGWADGAFPAVAP